ncbi:hypothetical protein [Brucella intermedia]|uniref:Uncharacterized protein n=1 Tax=Brucella intermedia M86 TaxID=1234597 RepID=M5JK20_9HYPH|nr:hypothetical protein [Brucella intermedia]ELT46642.1 hypothetical protein D584_23703 [Brucella intermedia M86]
MDDQAKELIALCEAHRSWVRAREALQLVASKVYTDPAKILEAAHEAAFQGMIGDTSLPGVLKHEPARFGDFRGRGDGRSTLEERRQHYQAIAHRHALPGLVREFIMQTHELRCQHADANRGPA